LIFKIKTQADTNELKATEQELRKKILIGTPEMVLTPFPARMRRNWLRHSMRNQSDFMVSKSSR
jgi:hypothetical protein